MMLPFLGPQIHAHTHPPEQDSQKSHIPRLPTLAVGQGDDCSQAGPCPRGCQVGFFSFSSLIS